MMLEAKNGQTHRAEASAEFWAAARDIAPLAVGVTMYGLAFGLLAAQAQMDGMQVGIMGGTVFAGASQIVAVERLVAGSGAATALLAGMALNLRLLLVTASLRAELSGRPWWQIALGVHLSTDENWALMHAQRAKGIRADYWYIVGGGAVLIVTWLISTVLGVSVAGAIPEPRALGIDFAFTAAFIAILCSLFKGRQDITPWGIVVAITIGLTLLSPLEPSLAMIFGSLSGAISAAVFHSKRQEEKI